MLSDIPALAFDDLAAGRALNGLRAIAALAVFAHHASQNGGGLVSRLVQAKQP